MNMRQPERSNEIKATIARMNAAKPGDGDNWGFEHAAHVMRDQIDAIRPPIPAGPVREGMIRMALAEMKDAIPGSESWPASVMKQGKSAIATEELRRQLKEKGPAVAAALGAVGGLDSVAERVGPLMADENFMKLSTEQKVVEIHKLWPTGTPGAHTAAFALAYAADNKDMLSTAAITNYVADKPLPFIEVSPRQIGDNLQNGLNSVGGAISRNLPSWMK